MIVALAAAALVTQAPQMGTPSVFLLDIGEAPYEILRLTPMLGAQQQITLTIRTRVRMKIGDMTSPESALPPVKAMLALSVIEVGESGVRYSFAVEKMEIVEKPNTAPSLLAALKAEVEAHKGFSGEATVSARGLVKLDPGPASKTGPMLGALWLAMGQLHLPLPIEPVGLGARWETLQSIEDRGMQMVQRAVYELVEWEGNVVRATVSLSRGAAPQALPSGGARLVSFASHAEGSILCRLDSIGPIRSKLISSSDLVLEAKGKQTAIHTDLDLVAAR